MESTNEFITELRIHKRYFDAIVMGHKKYEIRKSPHLAGKCKLRCVETAQTLLVELGDPMILTPPNVERFRQKRGWDGFCEGYVATYICGIYPIKILGALKNAKS